ncbi:ATP-binding cassette domain-containing protein [Staphylospora marina]|uniref:ATP-binding cassette domain-containing protein n=1 Tax=Staphylospora marina TaxID=2490858 RepID=UPI0013DE3478|nr:ATP-binding cassette domain-containing protein [Staphylospora marina]
MQVLVRNLTVIHQEGTPLRRVAVSDVNLSVNTGEFLAVTGVAGSGKSTLVRTVGGLIRPSAGWVQVGEIRVDARSGSLKELRRQSGVVFQFPEHQLFADTVLNEIAFGLLRRGIGREEAKERARRAMKRVGLSADLEDRSPFSLSGGQMRRVTMASVLALEPSLLILDEPTAGLDFRGRREMLELVERLCREEGRSVWMVTHDMDEAARHADRIVVLSEGRLIRDVTPAELFEDPKAAVRAGLEMPAVTRLVRDLEKAGGFRLPRGLFRPESLAEALDGRRKKGG